mmetsp:Transcript_66683/g.135820  ORF Transcript_66683/g.135820 Transcript_66683/m.135820 type:complete len:385 (+) Transcript_66683:664-1818(+)
MLVRRRGAVQDHLDAFREARHARRCFQVSHVALGAGGQDRFITFAQHVLLGTDLDGVPECSSCAMALCRRHLHRLQPTHLHRCPNKHRLGGPVRRRQAGTPPVLVDGAADDTCQPVCVRRVVIAHLHEGSAATFTTLISIGTPVEGVAAALVARAARRALPHKRHRTHKGVNADHKRPLIDVCLRRLGVVALIRHGMVREVQRHQGRGASSGHSICRPDKVQEVRQASASDARLGAEVPLHIVPDALRDHSGRPHFTHRVPVRPHIAKLHCDLLAHRTFPGVTGSVECLVADLEADALARVHAHRLLPAVLEEVVVKASELLLVEETAMVHVGLPGQHRHVLVHLVVGLGFPASTPFQDAVGAADEHIPVVPIAPAPPRHAHHE